MTVSRRRPCEDTHRDRRPHEDGCRGEDAHKGEEDAPQPKEAEAGLEPPVAREGPERVREGQGESGRGDLGPLPLSSLCAQWR